MQSEITLMGVTLESTIQNFRSDKNPRDYLFGVGYDHQADDDANSSERSLIKTSGDLLGSLMNQGLSTLQSLADQNMRVTRIKEKEDDMSKSARLSQELLKLIQHTLSSDRRLVLFGCILSIIIF